MLPKHDESMPPKVTVAVIDCDRGTSDASIVIFDVPWPLTIFPAVNDQVYVGFRSTSPPETVVTNVIACFESTALGQLTDKIGQGDSTHTHSEQRATLTDVEVAAVCWSLSLTSTVAV